MRIGQGTDVHAFGEGDHVVLGGVRIAHPKGIVAHSDGDVVIHALCDALLGAMGDRRHRAAFSRQRSSLPRRRQPRVLEGGGGAHAGRGIASAERGYHGAGRGAAHRRAPCRHGGESGGSIWGPPRRSSTSRPPRRSVSDSSDAAKDWRRWRRCCSVRENLNTRGRRADAWTRAALRPPPRARRAAARGGAEGRPRRFSRGRAALLRSLRDGSALAVEGGEAHREYTLGGGRTRPARGRSGERRGLCRPQGSACHRRAVVQRADAGVHGGILDGCPHSGIQGPGGRREHPQTQARRAVGQSLPHPPAKCSVVEGRIGSEARGAARAWRAELFRTPALRTRRPQSGSGRILGAGRSRAAGAVPSAVLRSRQPAR